MSVETNDIKKRYGTDEGNDYINKLMKDCHGLFDKDALQVIRFWGQWNGEEVVYSSKKTARILGVSAQTVQNWCKKETKWGNEVEFSDVMGYQIPLKLIIDEARIAAQFGKKHNINDKLFVGYEALDQLADQE